MKKLPVQIRFRRRAVFLVAAVAVCGLVFWQTTVRAMEKTPVVDTAAVLVSRKIRPYLEAVEGLKAGASKFSSYKITDIYYLDDFGKKSGTNLKKKLAEEGCAVFIAVGPEATRFVWQHFANRDLHLVYCMVSNPEKIIGSIPGGCGIPLNLPAEVQVLDIVKNIASVNRLGILFDPAHNESFYKEAAARAAAFNLEIIPLQTASRKEIPIVLNNNWHRIDALWLIPDRTIISERIVEYIIKESIFQKIPVIGYNRFFYESGAVLSFVLDYRKIGIQTAELTARAIAENSSQIAVPFYELRLNRNVMKVIGLDVHASGKSVSEAAR